MSFHAREHFCMHTSHLAIWSLLKEIFFAVLCVRTASWWSIYQWHCPLYLSASVFFFGGCSLWHFKRFHIWLTDQAVLFFSLKIISLLVYAGSKSSALKLLTCAEAWASYLVLYDHMLTYALVCNCVIGTYWYTKPPCGSDIWGSHVFFQSIFCSLFQRKPSGNESGFYAVSYGDIL